MVNCELGPSEPNTNSRSCQSAIHGNYEEHCSGSEFIMKHDSTVLGSRNREVGIESYLFARFTLTLTFLCLAVGMAHSQGVAINTSGAPADTSAMLDVASNTKGILIPRMTQ